MRRPAAARRPTAKVRRAAAVVAALTALVALAAALAAWQAGGPGLGGLRFGPFGAAAPVRLVAVGDMACDPTDPAFDARSGAEGDHCRHDAVSALALGLHPDRLLGLGDYQFEVPTAHAYDTVYGPSWGRLRDITIPVFGNQEYRARDGQVFLDYFGDRIGADRGYWSLDVGAWHVVVLNSNCTIVVGGCGDGSAQQRWLARDLAATDRRCVLAAWHHPRWSTGIAGPDGRTAALYSTLSEHGVELLLSAHDADYERFGPLDPQGHPVGAGVRQLVVGTGGQAHYAPTPADTPWRGKVTAPASAFFDGAHHGVLELDLSDGGWSWSYHPLDAPVTDRGAGHCG